MPTADATRIPRTARRGAETRLRRLRVLAWLLDTSIDLGNNRRIGIDPLIGLIPVVGDWLAAITSLYVVYEAMRLGLSWIVVARMLGNIAIDLAVGAVPVLGDAFDFVWQSNRRNVRLVDQHYHGQLRERSLSAIAVFFAAVVLVMAGIAGAALWVVVWLVRQIHWFG